MAKYRIVCVGTIPPLKYIVQKKFLWWWNDERVIDHVKDCPEIPMTTLVSFSDYTEAEAYIIKKMKTPIRRVVMLEFL